MIGLHMLHDQVIHRALTDFGDNVVLYILFALIGFNFVLEFAINAIFSPMVTYVIGVGKKIYFKQ